MKKNLQRLKNDLKYKWIFDKFGHNWSTISMVNNLPEDFIECYLNKLNLRNVCKHNQLSENFIEKHFGLLKANYCYKIILTYQPLSPEFKNKLKEM